MTRTQSPLMLAAIAALAVAAQAVVVVDQQQNAAPASYSIPARGIWQSFTVGTDGSLTNIVAYVGHGSRPACAKYRGRLTIFTGVGARNRALVVHTQAVHSSNCTCDDNDCIAWQNFELTAPLAVTSGDELTFHLSAAMNAGAVDFRAGFALNDAYPAGRSHFAAPGTDFAFRTMVDSVSVVSNRQDKSPSSSTSGGSSANVTAIVGACVGAILIVLVAVAARRAHGRQEKKWLSVEQATAELKKQFGGDATEFVPHTAEAEGRGRFGTWGRRSRVAQAEADAMPQRGDVVFMNNFVDPTVPAKVDLGFTRTMVMPNVPSSSSTDDDLAETSFDYLEDPDMLDVDERVFAMPGADVTTTHF